ncbi:hypothetical protein BT69DRAFT_147579 [Atractiella rhizophila]|nr:hypothetical protein BT69DRAFT_147579 [Atractiella rhizophila]
MPLPMEIAAKNRELCQQQQLQLIMPNSGKNKMRESFAYLHRIVICRPYQHDTCQDHKHAQVCLVAAPPIFTGHLRNTENQDSPVTEFLRSALLSKH